MAEQVQPGGTMFHTEMVTIPKAEYEKLKAVEAAFNELNLEYSTRLHEQAQDAS